MRADFSEPRISRATSSTQVDRGGDLHRVVEIADAILQLVDPLVMRNDALTVVRGFMQGGTLRVLALDLRSHRFTRRLPHDEGLMRAQECELVAVEIGFPRRLFVGRTADVRRGIPLGTRAGA